MIYSEIAIFVISLVAIWELCKSVSANSKKGNRVNVDRTRIKPRPKIDPKLKGNSMEKRKGRDINSRRQSLKPTQRAINGPTTSNNIPAPVQA